MPAMEVDYWQKRLDLADRVDKGQVSLEAANQLLDVYYQQLMAAVRASVAQTKQQEVA